MATEWLVSFSGSKRTVRIGSRWRQYLTDSTWEVVEPAGRSYSPSGLGGCQDFWCKPVGELRDPQACGWVRDYARADGCVEFCGDSIAAGLIDVDGVSATPEEALNLLREATEFWCAYQDLAEGMPPAVDAQGVALLNRMAKAGVVKDGDGVPPRISQEAWVRLYESQRALAQTSQRINEIGEKYGLDGDGVEGSKS